jgi:hypothetical protein
VTIDGHSIWTGFGPAFDYHTWPDGSVRTEDSGQMPLPLNPLTPDGEIINLNP